MNRLGGQVFARSAFAQNKNRRGRTRRDLVDEPTHLPHLLALTDEILGSELDLMLLLQQREFSLKTRGVQRLLHHEQYLVVVEGLHQVVECPPFHRVHGPFHRTEGGHQDDRDFGVVLRHVREHFKPGLMRHSNVQQQEVGTFILDHLQSLLTVLRLEDFVTSAKQVLSQRPADELLVVGNQDAFSHRLGARRADALHPLFLGGLGREYLNR